MSLRRRRAFMGSPIGPGPVSRAGLTSLIRLSQTLISHSAHNALQVGLALSFPPKEIGVWVGGRVSCRRIRPFTGRNKVAVCDWAGWWPLIQGCSIILTLAGLVLPWLPLTSPTPCFPVCYQCVHPRVTHSHFCQLNPDNTQALATILGFKVLKNIFVAILCLQL